MAMWNKLYDKLTKSDDRKRIQSFKMLSGKSGLKDLRNVLIILPNIL
jgi:hypothetical protein